MPNGCMSTGGTGLNWLVETFNLSSFKDEKVGSKSVHRMLDEKIKHQSPGSDGVFVIPYFLGEKTPIHDPDARGVIFGLSFNHGIGEIWKAFLESYCYAFKDHVNVFNEIGFETKYFTASDGGTRSRIWMQICADIIQESITILENNPGSCLGAAWMAAIATGSTDDWGGIESFVKPSYRVDPEKNFKGYYEKGFTQFKSLYQQLKDQFPKA